MPHDPDAPEPDEPADIFRRLFDHDSIPANRYGARTQAEYDKRRADALLKEATRAACDLCDPTGYRPNGYLCDHIDHDQAQPPA